MTFTPLFPDAPKIMFWTVVVAFLGYPVAFLYSFSAVDRRERLRRTLITTSATGIAVVSLVVAQVAALCERAASPVLCSDCYARRCLVYALCTIIGFTFSALLLVLESTRRILRR